MDATHTGPTAARRSRGLTLVELAIAIAVLAIVAATAVPSLAAFVDARRLDGAATQLAADVQLARTEAATRHRTVRLSLRTDGPTTTCWIVHTGAAGDCRCNGDGRGGPAACDAGSVAIASSTLVDADRLRVEGNVASMLFDPLHGTTTPAGTLRVVDARGRSVQHVVNAVGRVRTCSPGGTATGWAAC